MLGGGGLVCGKYYSLSSCLGEARGGGIFRLKVVLLMAIEVSSGT